MGRFLRTLPVETAPAYEKQPLPLEIGRAHV